MRKSLLNAVGAAVLTLAGSAQAALTLDLNGAAAGGVITATALDWSQTSFLARGGNDAVACFASGGAGGCSTTFDVFTHAKLTGYTPSGGGSSIGLPAGVGEITMVARFQETVTGLLAGSLATFATTGVGWLELYHSGAENAADLSGSGFNDGRLILKADGVSAATGLFAVTGGPAALDTFGANDYTGQGTVTGIGSQSSISVGTAGFTLDPTYFLTQVAGFSILFANISQGLPYDTANPSHCFNTTANGAAVGTSGHASTCDTDHVNGLFSAQGAETGYTPVIGAVNGFAGVGGGPDFIAQTDFNSAVTGLPEPATLGVVGLALLGMAAGARRRRQG